MNRNISVDADEQISGLIAGLPRVSVPADFDLKLRGRIARHDIARSSGFRLPAALAYAMGLGVVLIAFGLFGMAWIYSGQVGDVPEVAKSATTAQPAAAAPSAPAAPPSTTLANSTPAPEVSLPSAANIRASSVKPPVLTVEPRSGSNTEKPSPSPESSAGSLPVTAVKTARAVYPKGINPAAASGTPEMTVPVIKPVDTIEVLAVLGANAAFSGGKMRIESVNAGSAAENAGLKAGDVVESINDQSVNSTSKFAGNVKASSMRVQRDGKLIVILLGK